MTRRHLVVIVSAVLSIAVLGLVGMFVVRSVGGDDAQTPQQWGQVNADKISGLQSSLDGLGSGSALDGCSSVGDAADALKASGVPETEALKAQVEQVTTEALTATDLCVQAVQENNPDQLLEATQKLVTVKESFAKLQQDLQPAA